MKTVWVYTDGACRGNPGPGGWGALLIHNGREKEIKGGEQKTTNNRMELMAAIQALRALKQPCQVELVTDSQYLRKGITEWMANWKRRNWKTSTGKAVKNQNLWQTLDQETQRHRINWHWVKAHNEHPQNERADRLANEAIDDMAKED